MEISNPFLFLFRRGEQDDQRPALQAEEGRGGESGADGQRRPARLAGDPVQGHRRGGGEGGGGAEVGEAAGAERGKQKLFIFF